MTPEVSLLIVNWNVTDLLQQCLDSIRKNVTGVSHEVIVVDNASEDADVDDVAARYPECKFIKNTENICCAAFNQACDASRGRYVVILNPDTIILPGAIESMHAFLESHQEAAGVSATLLNLDGTLQTYNYQLPRLRTVLFCSTSYGRILDKYLFGRHFNRWYRNEDIQEPREMMPIEQPSLTCLMLRAEMFEGEELITPRFAYYFNDVDLSKRVRDKGKELYILPEARVVHFQGAAYKKAAKEVQTRHTTSLYAYFVKHHRNVAWLVKTMLLVNEAAAVCRRLARRDWEGAGLRLRIFGQLLSQHARAELVPNLPRES